MVTNDVVEIEAMRKEIEAYSVYAQGLAVKQATDDVDEDLEDLSVKLHNFGIRLARFASANTAA